MIAIVCAMKQELAGAELAPALKTLYSGIGKVNAALSTARLIHEHQPELIINFGTAGAVIPGLSGLVECGSAVQRDFDLRMLGVPLGADFGASEPDIVTWGEGYRVATGDQFATAPPELECDLVDMEAFAIARVCECYGVAFRCIKYISDGADEAAAQDWAENAHRGARLFSHWIAEYI